MVLLLAICASLLLMTSTQVQANRYILNWIGILCSKFLLDTDFLIPTSGVPDINSSWWAWIESCKCKSCGYIWSKLESCPRFTSPGQIISFWAEAACHRIPPSFCWLPRGTCLYPSGVQTAAIKYCCFRKVGKTIFWRCPGIIIIIFSWLHGEREQRCV